MLLEKELAFYQAHLANSLLPFWDKACDPIYGGVFTCFNNWGNRLLSRDKYVWSQGRMAWVYARTARDIASGMLPALAGRGKEYLEKAAAICAFLRRCAILPETEGGCAYLLTWDGTKKESIPGRGYYTSFFVDCFVILGFSEYALAAKNPNWLELALQLYDRIKGMMGRGKIVTEPYPIADGFESQAVDMILSCTSNNLWNALKAAGHPRAEEINRDSLAYVERILTLFYRPNLGVLQELRPMRADLADTFSSRHIMPGHALESMWFCIKILEENYQPLDDRIFIIAANSLKLGWDERFGGMLRCVDCEGGQPHGRRLPNDLYEQLMAKTWSSKLWWVHSETLYTTMLCWLITQDPFYRSCYERTRSYVVKRFLHPDPKIGEWVQILDRQGRPEDKLVALPVKDPFHIVRNVLMMIELLTAKIEGGPTWQV